MKRIVILGGGYGGLTAATHLLKEDLPEDTYIVLIDRMPFQGLKTEYYALASGSIADIELRVPFPVDSRLILKYGEVTSVDMVNKQVNLQKGFGQNIEPVSYERLIIALGCTDNYHGIPGAELYSTGIQSFSAARRTYQQINDVKPYGQVSIVGGGLSGVELASELRESRPDINIRIIDRGPGILSGFPVKLQSFVAEWFTEHEVEMRSNVILSRLEQGILYNHTESIYTDVTVWTAGIQPVEVVQKMSVPKDNQGRIMLNEFHQIPAFPDVFVIGDCANMAFSPSAQAAEAHALQVVEVLRAIWKGHTPHLKQIKLKGVLGSLGKKSGFGLLGKRTLIGKMPRVLKSGVLWMSKHHFG